MTIPQTKPVKLLKRILGEQIREALFKLLTYSGLKIANIELDVDNRLYTNCDLKVRKD
jgi:hypothetical protein